MNLLIRNATVNDPSSPLNGKIADIRIRDGVYIKSGSGISPERDEEVIDANGSVLCPGWFDMRVSFREPGEEQKETIRTGQDAAAQGGFTAVLMMPSTKPVLQTGSDIAFVKSKSLGHLVDVFPAGVLTENREGKDLSGMYDMKLSGAVAFTDDKKPVTGSGLMLRAIQYAGNIGSKLIAYADDPGLSGKLQVNESPVTTLLGFKGIPSLSESIALKRDFSLAEYAGQSIHVSGISTREAVDTIRDAKKKGLPVTAEVYVYHLLLDDSSLEGFDSNYKVKPPLRSVEDVEALKEAVLDGTIDVVCSDHAPHDPESKDVEFDYAAYGMISLESFYAVLNTAFKGKLDDRKIYDVLVQNPRKILNLEIPVIREGAPANFTLYNRNREWTFGKEHIRSRSLNTPFIGSKFTGKVIAAGNRDQYWKCV